MPLVDLRHDRVHGNTRVCNPNSGSATPCHLLRLADALAPGGWLVLEEADLGMCTMAGFPEAEAATAAIHELIARFATAGVLDGLFGRRVPGLVHELGLEDFAADATTGIGQFGDPCVEVMRMAWPQMRRGAAAVGLSDADLAFLDQGNTSTSAITISMTQFAAWGRKPQ